MPTMVTLGTVMDGEQYVAGKVRQFDPHAAKWWGVLGTAAEMLRLQDSPASKRQVDYLKRLLFGGMGSFVDFRIESSASSEASSTNARLGELSHEIYSSIGDECSRLDQPS